jgi:hypothetical protein
MCKSRHCLLGWVGAIALALTLSACFVEARPPSVAVGAGGGVAVGTDYYEPLYYDGYVVYYDAVGRPYHYLNGAVVWIAPSYPYYGYYVRHWRLHRARYHRWYRHRGYRYRRYRRRPGYYRHRRTVGRTSRRSGTRVRRPGRVRTNRGVRRPPRGGRRR